MAQIITYFLPEGKTHSTTFGAASYIFGTGVAELTFDSNQYIIDLNHFPEVQVGVGSATSLKCLSKTPLLVHSGATAHDGQNPTIQPTTILTQGDGAYTVVAADGNHLVGSGNVAITFSGLDTQIIDLTSYNTGQGIYVPTGTIVEQLSDRKKSIAIIGNYFASDVAITFTATDILTSEDAPTTIGSGIDLGYIAHISGTVKLTNSTGNGPLDSYEDFIDGETQDIQYPTRVNNGVTIEVQSGALILGTDS